MAAIRNKYCGRCGVPVHGQFCLDCRKADPIYFKMLKGDTTCLTTTS